MLKEWSFHADNMYFTLQIFVPATSRMWAVRSTSSLAATHLLIAHNSSFTVLFIAVTDYYGYWNDAKNSG